VAEGVEQATVRAEEGPVVVLAQVAMAEAQVETVAGSVRVTAGWAVVAVLAAQAEAAGSG
jgi:hypothetical protein